MCGRSSLRLGNLAASTFEGSWITNRMDDMQANNNMQRTALRAAAEFWAVRH
jgi:hypothetical protein